MVAVRNIPGSGPVWQNNVNFEDVRPATHWIVLEEELERRHDLFFLPRLGNAVIGRVLKAGPEAQAAGIKPNDRVIYNEWMGGRWIFPDRHGDLARVLLISLDEVSVVIR